MNCVLRGVRVIDPLAGIDRRDQDVRFDGGVITAIGPALDAGGLPSVDLTVPDGEEPRVVCPGFIDLHAHLRDPGDGRAETLATGAAAAAAGGFTQVLAMANTDPPTDSPERVAELRRHAQDLPIRVLVAAALTRGLAGAELVDIAACADAGADAFTDDGRNAAPVDLLTAGLQAAAAAGRPVLVHPEDEGLIARHAGGSADLARCSRRPPVAESAAVEAAIHARAVSSEGRLHLQHVSTEGSLELLARARGDGIPFTAEVTPHHLALSVPLAEPPEPASLSKVNPPLRSEADRAAMVAALRSGLIDAIATDHAPHPDRAKGDDYDAAAPGMIGLETALPVCLGAGGADPGWIALVVERLTAGPHRVLAARGSPRPPASASEDSAAPGVREPRLRVGEPATCVVFDPTARWVVEPAALRSRSHNTPLLGRQVRGRVLLTVVDGKAVHREGPCDV